MEFRLFNLLGCSVPAVEPGSCTQEFQILNVPVVNRRETGSGGADFYADSAAKVRL